MWTKRRSSGKSKEMFSISSKLRLCAPLALRKVRLFLVSTETCVRLHVMKHIGGLYLNLTLGSRVWARENGGLNYGAREENGCSRLGDGNS